MNLYRKLSGYKSLGKSKSRTASREFSAADLAADKKEDRLAQPSGTEDERTTPLPKDDPAKHAAAAGERPEEASEGGGDGDSDSSESYEIPMEPFEPSSIPPGVLPGPALVGSDESPLIINESQQASLISLNEMLANEDHPVESSLDTSAIDDSTTEEFKHLMSDLAEKQDESMEDEEFINIVDNLSPLIEEKSHTGTQGDELQTETQGDELQIEDEGDELQTETQGDEHHTAILDKEDSLEGHNVERDLVEQKGPKRVMIFWWMFLGALLAVVVHKKKY